jgi:hypothetical protein
MEHLIGKHIIIKGGGDHGITTYLESTYTKRGIYVHTWNDNIRNARVFDDYTEARVRLRNLMACSTLKNSDLRIRYVDKNFSLKVPKEEK